MTVGTKSTHLLADFWGCKFKELNDVKFLKKIARQAVIKANCRPLGLASHKFKPQGVSMAFLLEESHLSVHTYPEASYAAIDIFTCGNKAVPSKALEYLKKQLKPKRVRSLRITRGAGKIIVE